MMPQHYPIQQGLYGGEYPGHRRPEIAQARLWNLVEKGVRTFLDLTGPGDDLVRYQRLLMEVEQESGARLQHISMPIPDLGVPDSEAKMREIIQAIRRALAKRPAVYVHCWGGIGRTGTVVGCWLRECGHGPEDALRRVQELYSSNMAKVDLHLESPQTEGQREYIRRWQAMR